MYSLQGSTVWGVDCKRLGVVLQSLIEASSNPALMRVLSGEISTVHSLNQKIRLCQLQSVLSFYQAKTEFIFKNTQHLNKNVSLICYVYTNMCMLSNNLWLNRIHVLMHRSRIFPFGFWGIILFARNIRGLFLVTLQVWIFQEGWAQTSPFPLKFLHLYMYCKEDNCDWRNELTLGMHWWMCRNKWRVDMEAPPSLVWLTVVMLT